MANLGNQTEAKEVGENLGNMIDDRGHTEQGGSATIVLQMPEQKGEDQANAEAHEPGHEKEGCGFQIFKVGQHSHPLWQLLGRLGEHLGLGTNMRLWLMASGKEATDATGTGTRSGTAATNCQRWQIQLGRQLVHRLLLRPLIGIHELRLLLCRQLFIDGIVLEGDFRGGDYRTGHQHREDGEANVVVLLLVASTTGMIRERGGVIQSDADQEHRDAPAE